jgi:hypothetical protein
MFFNSKHDEPIERLESLHLAGLALTAETIANGCVRGPILSRAGKIDRIDQLLEARAWVDAALALVELELPQWKLRRLVCENGEWFCSLSRQPDRPIELDETADGCHEMPPIAILLAFLEARRKAESARKSTSATVPPVRPASGQTVCCDNFA